MRSHLTAIAVATIMIVTPLAAPRGPSGDGRPPATPSGPQGPAGPGRPAPTSSGCTAYIAIHADGTWAPHSVTRATARGAVRGTWTRGQGIPPVIGGVTCKVRLARPLLLPAALQN